VSGDRRLRRRPRRAPSSGAPTGDGLEGVRTRVPSDSTDAGLVVAIGRWDPDAFGEAYQRHAGAAYSLAWRITGDRHLAEEVIQDVFLRLWEHPERFEAERGTLRTYLLVQTHGRCMDLLRARGRRTQREERAARLRPADPYDLELEIWDLNLAQRVRAALETLTADERRAISLAYFGSRSYREVAGQLGEPEGTVKSRIRSGLAKLRDRLADGGLETPWLDA
jgi:RNA polymerase sigma-70 factor (ECF subfamily)